MKAYYKVGDQGLGLYDENNEIIQYNKLNAEDMKRRRMTNEIEIAPSVTKIDNHAFTDCGIASIQIPDSVERIGKEAFALCKKLEQIVVPKSVEFIAHDTFLECGALKSVDMSACTIERLPVGLFDRCSSLETVILTIR